VDVHSCSNFPHGKQSNKKR